jgi:antitoxin CcdA
MASDNLRRGQRDSPRRPTNVTLPAKLLSEAKALDINVSQACEMGLAAEVAEERRRRWRAENREAIQSYNDYIEQNGIPLAKYRQF